MLCSSSAVSTSYTPWVYWAHTGGFYTCAKNTQDCLSKSSSESWTKVLQLLGHFGFTGCTRKNMFAHVVAVFQDACILTVPSEIIAALHSITPPTVYQTLTNTGFWKISRNSGFWPAQNFCMGKGVLIRDPGSTDTLHIMRSPKFKKGYTLNLH